MPVFTHEHVALILIFLALFRPLCSPCWHIYVCMCVWGKGRWWERRGGGHAHARAFVCVCAHVHVCVLNLHRI